MLKCDAAIVNVILSEGLPQNQICSIKLNIAVGLTG